MAAEAAITVFEEIDWDPTPVLHPGMDFHDGVAYFTIPLLRNVIIPPKKKGEEASIGKQMQTYVITSEREGIWYDADSLDAHGFASSAQVYQERETRWSTKSARAFLEGKTTAPTSKDLFRRLREMYTTYVEFAQEQYHDMMALFLMYTYVFRLFETTGYIHFNGTAASGKSRNLSILDTLAFNAIWASSMSPASLYRKLSGNPGTTCIDETEGFEGERGEELRRILNAGYKDGATVTRTEKDAQDRFTPVEYEVFGPKALASINPLDNVLGSRSIVVAMRPAIRQLPDFLIRDKRWLDLRDDLYLWAIENMAAIAGLVQQWQSSAPDSKKNRIAPRIISRQWETTQQYVVLADYIGGEEFAAQMIAFFDQYFVKQQAALDATDRLRTTLRCLPRVLATKAAHPGHMYGIKDIHEVISSYMESDAAEYFKTKHASKNLDVLGFTTKHRGSGGLRIQLEEAAIRHEFAQRRVEPFDEDADWLAGKVSYQHATGFFDSQPAPSSAAVPVIDTASPWWESDDEEPQFAAPVED